MVRCLDCKHVKLEDPVAFAEHRVLSAESYETTLTCTNPVKIKRTPNVINKAVMSNNQFDSLGSKCEDFEHE